MPTHIETTRSLVDASGEEIYAPDGIADEAGFSRGAKVVLDEIGRGGMSVVFRAYDALLHHEAALKILRGGVDPAGPERMLQEARAMARLAHPNVVPVYDVGSPARSNRIAQAFARPMRAPPDRDTTKSRRRRRSICSSRRRPRRATRRQSAGSSTPAW